MTISQAKITYSNRTSNEDGIRTVLEVADRLLQERFQDPDGVKCLQVTFKLNLSLGNKHRVTFMHSQAL